MKVGDKIKDNDRRMGNRVLTITGLAGDYVIAKNVIGGRHRILVRRIHTDGQPRKGGFDLLGAHGESGA